MSRDTGRDLLCNEVVELLTDYLEGALAPHDVAAVEAHLSGCEGCATYLEQMRTTIRTLGSVPVSTLSAEAVDVLLSAFARRRPE